MEVHTVEIPSTPINLKDSVPSIMVHLARKVKCMSYTHNQVIGQGERKLIFIFMYTQTKTKISAEIILHVREGIMNVSKLLHTVLFRRT